MRTGKSPTQACVHTDLRIIKHHTHTHTHLREQELINEQLNKKAELLEKGSEQFKTTYEVKGRP